MNWLFAVLLFVSTSATADTEKPWSRVFQMAGAQGYHYPRIGDQDSESDCEKENAYQLSRSKDPSIDKLDYARMYFVGARLGCVYTGSHNKYILKLRNIGNPAVLCVAKQNTKINI